LDKVGHKGEAMLSCITVHHHCPTPHHGVPTRAILEFQGSPSESTSNSKGGILEQKSFLIYACFVPRLMPQ
jgi:hypothetical protein